MNAQTLMKYLIEKYDDFDARDKGNFVQFITEYFGSKIDEYRELRDEQ